MRSRRIHRLVLLWQAPSKRASARQTGARCGAFEPKSSGQPGVLAPTYDLEPLIPMSRLPAICGLSRSTLWRLRAAGSFPAGIKVGPGRRLFPAGEIRAWLADPAGYRADGS